MRAVFVRERPLLEITPMRPPVLIVMMAGTSVQQYLDAGQMGRLSASLERQTKYFRSVLFMTTDRTDQTHLINSDRVRHVRVPFFIPPFLSGGLTLLLSAVFRFRTVRGAASIVVLDEEAALAGWFAGRASGADLFMSTGAPWAPPRHMDISGKRHRIVRAALQRIRLEIHWPRVDSPPVPVMEDVEVSELPELVDADLFCPLTTTDPARPRIIGVFISTEDESDARVILGVAETMARRNQNAVLRVFLTGHGAESRVALLQAEVVERSKLMEFRTLPRMELLPDAIARFRMCIAFSDRESTQNLLRAMASGVPGILVKKESADAETDAESFGWSRFVLTSGPTEEEITRRIETLFREPGVRLRMAREGRRFVIAYHSLDALAAQESRMLLGTELLESMEFAPEPEFDADAEAEKLASMLESLGVARSGPDEVAA